jgi:hypothetical protein
MLCLLNPSDESFSMNQINPVMCLYSEMRLGLVWFCFSENRLFEKQDFLISPCPENMGCLAILITELLQRGRLARRSAAKVVEGGVPAPAGEA